MLQKKTVLKSIKDLPDSFEVDVVIDKLIVLHKIEKAKSEISAGKGVSTNAAKKKLQKWLR